MHHPQKKAAVEAEEAAFVEAAMAGDETIEGSREIYERHVDEAKRAAASERQPYRGGLPLARHNLSRGVDALAARQAEVEKREGVTVAGFRKLLDVVLALGFALSIKRRIMPSPAETPGLVQEAYGLRRLLLKSLDAVVEKGLLDPIFLTRVRAGQGHLDMLKDLVDLVAIFREHESVVAKRTPVEPSDLTRADQLAQRLQLVIKPKGAVEPAAKPAELVEIDAFIDGLWTLIYQGHKEMRRSGFLLWDDALDQHVPALLSRERPKKKTQTPEEKNPESAPEETPEG